MKLFKSFNVGEFLWSLRLMKEDYEVFVGENSLSSDDKHIPNKIFRYDIRRYALTETIEAAHDYPIQDIIEIIRDQSSIFTCSYDNQVKLWKKGKKLNLIGRHKGKHTGQYYGACSMKKESTSQQQNNSIITEDGRREERIGFILNDLADMKIVLKKRELNVWKMYFGEKDIDFSDLSLDVSEETILQILLSKEEKDVDIPYTSLFDYFRFFRRLKMKNEMYLVLKKLSSCSSKKICGLFQGICKTHENSQVKKIFEEKDDGIGEVRELTSHMPDFDFSFSLFLFNIMKDREDEILSNLSLLNAIGPVLQCLKNHRIVDIFQHLDFFGVEKESELISTSGAPVKLKNLYSSKTKSDIILKCAVGNVQEGSFEYQREFKAHQIVLVLKSNFFYCMLHFGGREVEELKKTGKITIEFLSENVIEAILKFVYLGEICSTKLPELLLLLKHAEMYHEGEMIKCVAKKIEEVVKEKSEVELMKLLESDGHILENEVLLAIIVNSFRSKLSKKKIVDIVESSLQTQREEERFEEERNLKQEMITRMKTLEEGQASLDMRMKENQMSLENLKLSTNSKLEDLSGKVDEILMLFKRKKKKARGESGRR